MNQCDGCQRGLPINKHGNHQGEGYDIIGCTKHLYEGERMSKHTPEPWPEFQQHIGCGSLSIEDYKRARACVNALQGVPTECLEDAVSLGIKSVTVVDLIEQVKTLKRQDTELLEALIKHGRHDIDCKYLELSYRCGEVSSKESGLPCSCGLDSAIAKAKGEA